MARTKVDELIEKRRLLEAKKTILQRDLPHLHLYKWYPWAYDFFTSTNPVTLLCAANQISKSSTQIRKFIHWATEDSLWVELWGDHQTPNLFWYFYPTKEVATVEFKKKWMQFLPTGTMKDDPKYGWSVTWDKKFVDSIEFNSGITIAFKSYNQSVSSLQSSTVFAVGADEELPEDYYDELMFRLAATDGYFSMAFTATLGQQLWWRAMECVGKEEEFLPEAKKIQVSMFDCLEYKDGSETPWNEERIAKVISKCRSKAEVLRRVYGRFVKEGGKKYHTFDPQEHYMKPDYEKIKDWNKYCAVDLGSGGSGGHPSAIIFLAVRPDYKEGVFYKAWRGDGIETLASDVYEKFLELKENDLLVRKWYDHASAEFNTLTTRMGDPFEKAKKSHDLGESMLNTLFKNNMLKLFNTEELRKLGSEMLSLQRSTPKTKAKDDLCDAARYCVVDIPWNLNHIKAGKKGQKVVKSHKMPENQDEWNKFHDRERAKGMKIAKKPSELDVLTEIEFWNSEF